MMVNETSGRIKLLLEILSESPQAVSGEKLAAELGVSRVSVWKMITALNEKGYSIESGRSGYRLTGSTDKPLAWELETPDRPVHYHDELDSTMHKAALLLEAGCEDGTTVIAGSQSSGKNAGGGSWSSPDGGLYLTRIRTRPFPAAFAGLSTLAAAAAAVKMLQREFGVEASVSWPGGITVRGMKVGGVLTEYRGSGGMIVSISTGIGLNLNSYGVLPGNAAALSGITGGRISVKAAAAALIDELETQDGLFPFSSPVEQYYAMIEQAGRKIRFSSDGRLIRGRIEKLNQYGLPVVRTEEGGFEYIFSGDTIEYE